MCGIGGWLGNLSDSEFLASRMVKVLHHRGPDGSGIKIQNNATLVHTRLSVIDLSPSGSQPMSNEDETIWVVFNGEIYNHHELRRRLEKNGHKFRGHSDTEVLPHLYEEEGRGFVEKLRGMFALAIYDTRSKILLIARDRFGIKPLFYAPSRQNFAFASEIRALLDVPGIDLRPNRQAVYDFAALCYIPAPETFYSGISALRPGEIIEARLDASGIINKSYSFHQWTIAPDPTVTFAQATDRVLDLLGKSVQRQLESDVPLGALLSGGIDSSLVSTLAQEAMRVPLRTFNVRFSESDYDETWAAVTVAKSIGSDHETLDMDGIRGTWDHVTGLLAHAGQPFADTSLFAVNAICRLMRQYVTVALSGDGGDEGFAGYDLYWQIKRIARWQNLPKTIKNSIAAGLGLASQFNLMSAHLPSRIRQLANADDTAVIQSLFCFLGEEDHGRLCRDDNLLPVRRHFEKQWEHRLPARASRLARLAAHATEVNTRLTLPNDFLFKVDTASMKESLEVRVPMLDEDLFDFGLSLPHHLNVRGRTCKRTLRAVAKRKLSGKIANKRKAGFGVPVDSWVDNECKARLRDVLLGSRSRLPEYFHPEAYKPMVEAFCDGHPCPGISRGQLHQLTIMLLSIQLAQRGIVR